MPFMSRNDTAAQQNWPMAWQDRVNGYKCQSLIDEQEKGRREITKEVNFRYLTKGGAVPPELRLPTDPCNRSLHAIPALLAVALKMK
jgi:hypothetical protein